MKGLGRTQIVCGDWQLGTEQPRASGSWHGPSLAVAGD